MSLNESNEGNEVCSSHEAFKRFMDILEDGDWICTSTITLPDGRVFDMLERSIDTKLPVLKCVGVVKTTPEKLLDLFTDSPLEIRKKVTPNLSKYEIVKEFEPNIHLLHYVYKAPFPVKSRDFCLKRFVHRYGENILVCGISIEDDDLPPLKKYIRGEIMMSGYYFESISEEETKVTSIVYVDPKGWIPNFVVKASKNGELNELTNLVEVIENVE